jgi:formylglycine-generating enzyme required for sulfatase activity
MKPSMSAPGAAFAKVLRTFQTGGIAYGDFLAQVKQQLAAGASPAELLDILLRREVVEPLPVYAHEAVAGLLNELQLKSTGNSARPFERAIVQPAAPPKQTTAASAASTASAEAATVILDESDGAAPAEGDAQHASLAVGDVVRQRFQLIEMIGEGGMSRVYKAIDLRRTEESSPDPYLAVKILSRPFNDDSGSFSALQQEAAKLQKLSHPNIVRLFECDRDGSTVFMTMQYLVGESLYTRLRAGAPAGSPSPGLRHDARSIITAIAEALTYAHQNHVVHGDLKPGNVIVTEAGEVKVIDFGIASWVARPKTALERREAAQSKITSAVTPRYASPQLMARQKPEIADDVYAFACLTYELITGSHPFDDGTGAQTLRFPPPPHAQLSPPQYTALVRALQFERRNRTPSIPEFMEEFTAPEPQTVSRTRAIWLCTAAILIAIGCIGWFYERSVQKAPSPPSNVGLVRPAPLPTPAPSPPTVAASGSVIRDCPTCPSMTVLPIGRFQQGSASGDSSSLSFEKPQHQVAIGYQLAVSTNDVTVADFSEFIAATGRPMQGCDIYDGEWRHRRNASWKDPGFVQTAMQPVTCTSWDDAIAYAQWLSAKSGHRYRLPSASEWEYAARAGGQAVQPWNPNGSDACANANVADQRAAQRFPGWDVFACNDGYVNTAPVGSFKANAFGLNDMLGNVFQWTQDCWHDDYAGAPTDGSARKDGDCTEHELRGGSWFSSPRYVRASYRNHFAADYRTSSVGIRLVREISP